MVRAERYQTARTGKDERLLVAKTDNAKEFIALENWAVQYGIKLEFTESYTPAQNGVAQRLNRLLLEIARAMIFDAQISGKYWQYAVETANYIRNRSIVVVGTNDKTPFELWHGTKPNLRLMKRWGCKVLYHDRSDNKLATRASVGTFVKYTKSDSQYFVMTTDGKLKKVTRPVFFETQNGPLSTTGSLEIEREFISEGEEFTEEKENNPVELFEGQNIQPQQTNQDEEPPQPLEPRRSQRLQGRQQRIDNDDDELITAEATSRTEIRIQQALNQR